MAVAFFDAAFGLAFFVGRHAPRTRGIPAAGTRNGVFRLGIFEFGIAGGKPRQQPGRGSLAFKYRNITCFEEF
jgi:hypothetical protein